jgi:hypothetical protein
VLKRDGYAVGAEKCEEVAAMCWRYALLGDTASSVLHRAVMTLSHELISEGEAPPDYRANDGDILPSTE